MRNKICILIILIVVICAMALIIAPIFATGYMWRGCEKVPCKYVQLSNGCYVKAILDGKNITCGGSGYCEKLPGFWQECGHRKGENCINNSCINPIALVIIVTMAVVGCLGVPFWLLLLYKDCTESYCPANSAQNLPGKP